MFLICEKKKKYSNAHSDIFGIFVSLKLAYRYANFFWNEENPPKMQGNGSLLSWLKVVSLFLFHFELKGVIFYSIFFFYQTNAYYLR